MLEGDVPHPSLGSLDLIGDVAVIDLTVGPGKVRSHGGHDDPVLQFQFSDSERAKEGLKEGHGLTSVWDFGSSEHITGGKGRAIHELPMGLLVCPALRAGLKNVPPHSFSREDLGLQILDFPSFPRRSMRRR